MTHKEKIHQTMIAKYGSLEQYSKAMSEYGKLGGKTLTEKTRNRGFGTNRELAKTAGQKGGSAKRLT
jgi:general stress protein YciG